MLYRWNVLAAVMTVSLAAFHPAITEAARTSSNDMNEIAEDGNHMIFQRILRDDLDGVRAYLDVGADPNVRGVMEQTASISSAA